MSIAKPRNEQELIYHFVQLSGSVGFRIISITTRFPDAIIKRNGQQYRVEFEYKASNFYTHKHDPAGCDLIICWEDDDYCPILPIIALNKPNWYWQEIKLIDPRRKTIEFWRDKALEIEAKFNIEVPKHLVRDHLIRYWKERALNAGYDILPRQYAGGFRPRP